MSFSIRTEGEPSFAEILVQLKKHRRNYLKAERKGAPPEEVLKLRDRFWAHVRNNMYAPSDAAYQELLALGVPESSWIGAKLRRVNTYPN